MLFLGVLGKIEKDCILRPKCGFLCPFWGCRGGFAEWKKGVHFGAQVWISMPFLGLSGVCGAEKGQAVRGFRTGVKKIVV